MTSSIPNSRIQELIREVFTAHEMLKLVKKKIHRKLKNLNKSGTFRPLTKNEGKTPYRRARNHLETVLHRAVLVSDTNTRLSPSQRSRLRRCIKAVIDDLSTNQSRNFNITFNWPEKRYFSPSIRNASELKTRYKQLALKMHPNKGGDNKEFKIMSNQYQRKLEQLS